jgi:NAD dependent epimerase/dehydratase family enzyme
LWLGLGTNWIWRSSRMETEISEKVQRLTGILVEEAEKFPRITVSQYSTGIYGYDWKVYLDEERQLGTISFTTDLALSERELRAAFRHELRTLVRYQTALGDHRTGLPNGAAAHS